MGTPGFVAAPYRASDALKSRKVVRKMSLSPMSGGYRVGVLDLETPRAKERSAFLARVFYPTDGEVGKPVQWNPEGGVLAKYLSTTFSGLPKWACAVLGWILAQTYGKTVVPDTYYAPRIGKSERKFPTVVFCHGLYGDRRAYTALCRSIASDGNVVFALEHRDGSAPSTQVTDEKTGEKTQLEFRRLPKGSSTDFAHEFRSQMLSVRLKEVEAVADYVKELANGAEPLNLLDLEGKYRELLSSFAGKIDPNKLSVVGHSFGGTTALLSCINHPKRYSGCVLQDPWMFPLPKPLKAEDGPQVRIPFIAVLNERTVWPENYEVLDKIAPRAPNAEFVTLKSASHQAQSDFAVVLGPRVAKALKISQDGEDFEPLYESIAISLMFLRKHVHREGEVALEPEILKLIEPYGKRSRILSNSLT